MSRAGEGRQNQAGGLSEAAFGAVSNHGAADLFCCGEADANDGFVILARAHLDDDSAMGAISAFRGRQKLGPRSHALNGDGFGQGFAPRCERCADGP
jgi:hypothetical protein